MAVLLAACIVSLLTFGARPLQAGVDTWTSNGPGGGNILALTIDPVEPNTLYAATNNGLFKSTDAGATWAAIDFPALPIFDPTTPTTLYAAYGGVLKSTDGGASWSAANMGLPDNPSVRALAIDPGTPTTLYAGTYDHGLFKSTDGGASWSAANTGLPDNHLYIQSLAIDSSMPTTLYVGTEYCEAMQCYTGATTSAVFKSTDGGASWSAANTGLPPNDLPVYSLAIDPATPSTLYALTEALGGVPSAGNVYKSTDGGGTWNLASAGLPIYDGSVTALAIDPITSSTLYAVTYSDVFRSTDGGDSWSPNYSGLRPSSLIVNPFMPSTLYVGTFDKGVFMSTDAGMNWEPVNAGLRGAAVGALAVSPATPSTLYASTIDLFKSTDGGDTWRDTGAGFPDVNTLAVDPATPTTVYVGTASSGIFKSVDGGATWSEANRGLSPNPYWISISALTIDPITPMTLYTVAGGGLFKSTEGAGEWVSTGVLQVRTLVIDPQTPSTLYAGLAVSCSLEDCTNGGILKSMDGGTTWNPSGVGLPDFFEVAAFAIDPATPTMLYVGTDGSGVGVFRSRDGGLSWSSSGLTDSLVLALVIDPLTPTTLYAGTADGGVFKSTDDGDTWGAFNPGLPTRSVVNTLAIDPLAPTTLYAATQAGVFRIDQGGAVPTTTSTSSTTTSTNTPSTTTPPSDGCTAAIAAARVQIDSECDCGGAPNHASYRRCAKVIVRERASEGTLPKACRPAVRAGAARSTCGRLGFVTCCLGKHDKSICRIKRATTCETKGGIATGETSCANACAAVM